MSTTGTKATASETAFEINTVKFRFGIERRCAPHTCPRYVFISNFIFTAAAFFIIFQPYGYNHKERNEQIRGQQELTDTARGNAPMYLPSSPSNKYNQLDAAVFLALAMVIAICIYRLYLTTIGSTTSIPALTLQSILLFLPAAWFALHILFFVKKEWPAFRRWFTGQLQIMRRNGKVYDRVPNDENEEREENDERE